MAVSLTRKSQPVQPEFSCANCKHRFPIGKDGGECRAHPKVFIYADADQNYWASPPAPVDFLCGDHVIKYNS